MAQFRELLCPGRYVRGGLLSLPVVLVGLLTPAVAQREESEKPEKPNFTIEVIDISPVLGSGVKKDRVPANVQTITHQEIGKRKALSLSGLLNQKLGNVTVNDATTNPFQQDLRLRGFTASPLLGLPQGIAVYQNGVRINEAFGDTVQFDLIPDFAIQTVQIIPGANPVYGLNALGGAIGLEMKNGFTFQGAQAEAYGGSFGRYNMTGQYGTQIGNLGAYLGLAGFGEDGWRDESHSDLVQAFGDLNYRDKHFDLGGSLLYTNTDLNGNGLAPIELLATNRQAVFTFPDNTRNELAFLQTRANYFVTQNFSVQSNAYYRNIDRKTLNGDEGEFEVCDSKVRLTVAPADTLCAEGQGASIINIVTGDFVTASDAAGDGVFNRTITTAHSYGASLQGTYQEKLFGLESLFLLGGSVDFADIDFASNTEIGSLTPDRTVNPTGIFIGEFEEALNDEFNTNLFSQNRLYGIYISDTLSLIRRLHLTLAGRYNHARIKIFDNLGSDLDGNHVFNRFNPAIGLTYPFADQITGYVSYSEANRSPNAAELSCANPEKPCRVPNAFISDPPLDQVISRSVEIGARGRLGVDEHRRLVHWSIAAFGTRNVDDIIFVASPDLIGTGFFQNSGRTLRRGAEFSLNRRDGRFDWYVNYGFVRATFESTLTLPSDREINDAASEKGELRVEPGDRLPGVPLHTAKLGVSYPIIRSWNVAFESILVSSQIFLGDEGNDQIEVDGYGIVNLRSSYPINDNLEAFVIVNNLFDHNYETIGALAQVAVDLAKSPGKEDPRFLGPGATIGIWGGLRIRF